MATALFFAVACTLAEFRLFWFRRWGSCWGWVAAFVKARVVRLVVLGFYFLPRLICWRRDLRRALRRRLVDGGGGRRFSLCRGRCRGRFAGFLLGACGGRRLGGVGV